MNGPCNSWKLDQWYTWAEFKKMPQDIQIQYINRIINVYDVGIVTIATIVFGTGKGTLWEYLRKNGIKEYINIGKPGHKVQKSNIERLAADVNKSHDYRSGHTTEDGKPEYRPDDESPKTPANAGICYPPKPSYNPGAVRYANFGMDGFDEDTLRMIAGYFEGQKVRVSLQIEVMID